MTLIICFDSKFKHLF